jgi:hypothetical protein
MVAFLIGLVVGFVGGFVTSYLVLRNNQSLKAKVDATTNAWDSKK